MSKTVTLYLMRHAAAEDGKVMDSSRQLTDDGELDLKDMAAFAAHLGIEPDVIVTSTFDRAVQTGAGMAKVLDAKPEQSELLNPDGDPEELWDKLFSSLAENNDSIMLITHEPLLKRFMDLALGVEELPLRFKRGSIMRIDYVVDKAEAVATSDITVKLDDTIFYPALRWFVTPKVVGRLL